MSRTPARAHRTPAARQLRSAALLLRLLPLALLLCASGCLTVHPVDLAAGLERYRPEPVQGIERREEPMVVYVVAQPLLGGVVRATQDSQAAQELGSYRAELFPLDPERSVREQCEERAAAEEGEVLCGLEVRAFAETLARLLRKRLGERFARVEVRVVPDLEASQGIAITAEAETYLEVIPTSEKTSLVRLRAELQKGALVVRGRGGGHVNRGHLVWAVPSALVSAAALGPAGVLAVQLGFARLEAHAMEDSLVRALDEAARKLAERLASEPNRPVPLDLGGVRP
ncbi:MAG: hypothetical protein D6731_18355 [Planctomycetota bacterium]|nr:MAG: hypothetical protein D6731_18355 [Planctomycetota bacterium]